MPRAPINTQGDVGGTMVKNILNFILFWTMIGVRGHIGEHNKKDVGEN
jgi:hypothetical protein